MATALLSKTEVNNFLKKHGLKNVYSRRDEYGYTKSLIKDMDGKRIFGFRVASIGPMTITTAHREETRRFLYELRNSFLDEVSNCTIDNFTDDSMDVTIEFGGNKKQSLYFRYNLYRTYTYEVRLDPLYMTYWLTLSKK